MELGPGLRLVLNHASIGSRPGEHNRKESLKFRAQFHCQLIAKVCWKVLLAWYSEELGIKMIDPLWVADVSPLQIPTHSPATLPSSAPFYLT